MKFSAALDVTVVAHEAPDEITILLDLQAPDAPESERSPAALEVVLDRSGSMGGPRIEGAKRALAAVVTQLSPTDVFGLVTFDDDAQVVIPAGPLADKAATLARIAAIEPRRMTDMSSGYLRRLRELNRGATSAGIHGGTILVISDGHVNRGVCEPDEFAGITARAAGKSIVTSTLGYGDGYDESLLSAIARSGNGNHVFAGDPDGAGAAIAIEVDGLLSKSAQAVTLTVKYEPTVQTLSMYNDLPAHQVADGQVMIELGDMYALEERKLLLRMNVDGLAALGLTQIASIELTHVETATLVEHTASSPVMVNVVPGDELKSRIPDPTVHSEKLFREAQAEKLRASQAFEEGDDDAAREYLARSRSHLADGLAMCPDAGYISAEMAAIDQMDAMSHDISAGIMSKRTRDSYHTQNRKRGR